MLRSVAVYMKIGYCDRVHLGSSWFERTMRVQSLPGVAHADALGRTKVSRITSSMIIRRLSDQHRQREKRAPLSLDSTTHASHPGTALTIPRGKALAIRSGSVRTREAYTFHSEAPPLTEEVNLLDPQTSTFNIPESLRALFHSLRAHFSRLLRS